MTIPAEIGDFSEWAELDEWFCNISGEKRHKCDKCGIYYITCNHGNNQHEGEKLCVECAGQHNSYDKERRRVQQREYARRYRRVETDHRRKENRG
jgi:hypothetical protein